MSAVSRREFLKRTTAFTGAASAAIELQGLESLLGAEQRPALKYAICNETFGDWPQDKIFRFAAECGYTGIEIAPFTINNNVTNVSAQQRTQLRQQADKAGVQIIGLHWLLAKTQGLHLTSPDANVRRKTSEYLVELARFCKDLGGRLLIFGSPQQRKLLPGVSFDQAMKHAAEVFRQIMPALEKLGIVLALEPLAPRTDSFLNTAAQGVQLAELVNSPSCRLHLDCNAMSTESAPIPDLIRKYATWLEHFHANDPNSRGPGMGDLDFTPIFRALREIDYRGWVSVEVFDQSPGPERIARESIAYMKRIEAQVR